MVLQRDHHSFLHSLIHSAGHGFSLEGVRQVSCPLWAVMAPGWQEGPDPHAVSAEGPWEGETATVPDSAANGAPPASLENSGISLSPTRVVDRSFPPVLPTSSFLPSLRNPGSSSPH